MPLYKYKCINCGKEIEVLLIKIPEQEETQICGECGSEMEKTPTCASIKFNGRWYSNGGY